MEPKWKRILILIMGFIESFFFSAIVFTGWHSLVIILKQEGVYEYMCSVDPSFTTAAQEKTYEQKLDLMINNSDSGSVWINPTSNTVNNATHAGITIMVYNNDPEDSNIQSPLSCPERDKMFDMAYTLAVSLPMILSILMGKIFDVFGMRILRILASLMFMPGAFCIAFVDNENSWLIFPGAVLMATAGICLIITNQHLTLLAGNKKSTMSTVYTGAMECSMLVFNGVKSLWEKGTSHTISMCVVAALWMVVIVNTFVLFPKVKVNRHWTDGNLPHRDNKSKTRVTMRLDTPNIKECISSSAYFLHVLWFCISILRISCFFILFNEWLKEITSYDTEKVSFMKNMFSYVLLCGILVFAPLLGLSIDWCKNRLYANSNNLVGSGFAAMPVLLLSAIMAILVSIIILIPKNYCGYLLFVFFAVFKTSTFGIFLAYFNVMIPTKHFGTLLGLATSMGGVFVLLQLPLTMWSENSSVLVVNCVLLVLSFGCLAHPVNLCVQNRPSKPRIVDDCETYKFGTEIHLLKK